MALITNILCPVDFSTFSRNALDHAAAIARWYDAPVTALHVLPAVAAFVPASGEGLYPPLVFSEDDLRQFRDELDAFARQSGVAHIVSEVVQGSVSREVVRRANTLPADLIVMGTHGRSGFDRLMLGSTTESLLRKAPCPVLTVPAHAPDVSSVSAPFTRVLCAVDFSPESLRALALAESLASEAAARLSVMHVLEPVSVFEPVVAGGQEPAVNAEVRRGARHRLEELISRDTRAFADVAELVVSGKPYREILREAADQGSDLIVIGAHGGRLGLPAFGSTTNHLVREATCPVLTVRTVAPMRGTERPS
jgi:nucleotide-binding universal stress UspA family protein